MYELYKVTYPNGEYYYGQNKQNKKYFPSTLIKEGADRKVIRSFKTRQEAWDAESEILGDLWKTDDKCLNKHPGGQGSWEYVNENNLSGGSMNKNCQEARDIWLASDEGQEFLKVQGKWLGTNYGLSSDSKSQSERGKLAAKSINHPNNQIHKCIHCGAEMNLGHISRYHNDNCKNK